jgi:hypothetical protein
MLLLLLLLLQYYYDPQERGKTPGLVDPYMVKATPSQLAHSIRDYDQYGVFVPPDVRDEDGKLSSSPEEREVMSKTFWELVQRHGLNEMGAEVDEFHRLVHAIEYRNRAYSAMTGELIVPFIVVERTYYATVLQIRLDELEKDKTTGAYDWVDYCTPDDKFFLVAKELSKLQHRAAKGVCKPPLRLFFAMISKPGRIKMTHFHVCALCFDSESDECGEWHAPMAVFGAEGDQQDGETTVAQQYSLPYQDGDAPVESRPRARHVGKLFDANGMGVSCNVQEALEKCHWSGQICAAYVLNLIGHLTALAPGKLSEFATSTKQSAAFHRQFTKVLAKAVKRASIRYLSILKGVSTDNPVDAIIVDLADPIAWKLVRIVAVSKHLRVCVESRSSKAGKLRFLGGSKDGLYILGRGDIAVSNKAVLVSVMASESLVDEDKCSDINNICAFLEDYPGGKLISDNEGNYQKSEVPMPDLETMSDELLDETLFAAALGSGSCNSYTVRAYVEKAAPQHDHYRIQLTDILEHPMFGLLTVKDNLLSESTVKSFWGGLVVPDCMRNCTWSTDHYHSSQTLKNEKSCAWKWVTACLGDVNALAFTWLQKIGKMMLWKRVGLQGGATFTQMTSAMQLKLLLSNDTEQCALGEAIEYALKYCSPLRVFSSTKLPNNEGSSSMLMNDEVLVRYLEATGGCGCITGWPKESEQHARTKENKTLRRSLQGPVFTIHSIQQIPNDTEHVNVFWDCSNCKNDAACTCRDQQSIELRCIIQDKGVFSNLDFLGGKRVQVWVAEAATEAKAEEKPTRNMVRFNAAIEANTRLRSKFAMKGLMHTVPAFFDEGVFHPMANKASEIKKLGAIFEFFQKNKQSRPQVQKLYVETSTKTLVAWSSSNKTDIDEMQKQGHLRFRNPAPRVRVCNSSSSSSSSTLAKEKEVTATLSYKYINTINSTLGPSNWRYYRFKHLIRQGGHCYIIL